jgi:hypothetical protein
MGRPRAWAVAVGCVAVVLAGCTDSSGNPSASLGGSQVSQAPVSSASSSPEPLSPVELRSLLISAAQIPVPGVTLSASSTGTGTDGAAAEFGTSDGTTTISDVISVFPTEQDAAVALAAAEDVAPERLDTSSARRLPSGGQAFTGTSDGQNVTYALFTVGRVFAALRFQSDPGDPLPADVIDQVVQAQAAQIKSALP